MDIYPALDIQGGRVARAQGRRAEPRTALAELTRGGARWIHLVDFDRAYGRSANPQIIEDLLRAVPPRVATQVGGGLALEIDVDQMFTWGATRVIIGPRGALDAALVDRLVARHSAARLAAGIDAREGRVAPRGTAEISPVTARQLAERVRDQGIRTIVYNDVGRDGTLQGPDVDGAGGLAALGLDVIVSGGVGSLDDLVAARAAGLAGVIVGRALHEGRFTLAEALACVA
ncbi:MAG: HisA/HisF-related TIM barrel protein [Gemmatimonadales bacterium]